MSTPNRAREQVYELRDASWFDRGTGYCRGVFDETNDLALLVVEPEDAAAAGVEGREPEGEGGFLKDDLLLNARVEKEDIYTRQQGEPAFFLGDLSSPFEPLGE
jgi:protein phosphatase-4 regulatory subunit 3